jgi:hypothetical protein
LAINKGRLRSSIMKSVFLVIFCVGLTFCTKVPEGDPNPVFTKEDETLLSEYLLEEIFQNPSNYGEIIDADSKKFIYDYVLSIKDSILNTGKISNAYNWNIYLIDDSLQGMSYGTPGGNIFLSTGLLLFMQGEDELAAVLSKEMYYQDEGILTNKILSIYGIPLTKEVFQDTNRTNVPTMVQILRTDPFSLNTEESGDLNSVNILCEQSYTSSALATLYDRISFSDEDILNRNFIIYQLGPERINAITAESFNLNCTGSQNYFNEFQVFKDSLKN